MSLGRLWRTLRHLNAEQWRTRLTRRGGHLVARLLPGAWAARLERRAAALPFPNPGAASLAAMAGQVLAQQTAVHGAHLDAMAQGRFTFLGETLDFGSIEAVDWRRDAPGDHALLWRLNLGYMGYAVPWLAAGTDAGLARVASLVRGLEAQNPWTQPGVFRDVWNPYTASHRLINLLAGLHLHGGAGDDAEVIRDHLRRCAAHIAGNLEKDLQFNHLMKNLTALAVYAAALEGVPTAWAWLEREVLATVPQNVLADGGHAERSPMYHLLGLQDLRLLAATGLFSATWAAPLADAIEKVETALRLLSHPDGDIALFNDAWLGEAPSAGAVAPGTIAPGRHDLAETGYVRLDGGADVVILDAGPCGPDANPGHAHADFLSVEASVGGARFLVDPGTAAYVPGALRDRCRSAAEHNGPHLDGAEPIEFWHAFRVGRRGTAEILSGFESFAPLAVAGRQDGYAAEGVTVARFVGLWPGESLLIVDAWTGPAAARAATRFLVPGDWQPDPGEPGLFHRGGRAVHMTLLSGSAGAPEETEWWPRFAAPAPAHALTVMPEAVADGAWLAVRFTWDGGAAMADVDRDAILAGLTASR